MSKFTGLTQTDRQTTVHAHTYGQFKVTNEPCLYVFGLIGENPHRHGEAMQTPHRKAPATQNISESAICSTSFNESV